jgi:hypothetical protein
MIVYSEVYPDIGILLNWENGSLIPSMNVAFIDRRHALLI